jgi:hypothetical protein
MVGAFDGGARGHHITSLKVSAMQFLPPKLLKVWRIRLDERA